MKMYKEFGLKRMNQERLEAIAKEELGIDVDLDSDKDQLIAKILKNQAPEVDPLQERIDRMNDLAERIWEGQSTSEPLVWRVGRVKEGLCHHGYEDLLKHLELPEKGFTKYM